MYNRSRYSIPGDVRYVGAIAAVLVPLAITMLPIALAQGEDYVLLQNGNVIQGTVVPVGSMVVIRNGAGNELKLNVNQVAFSASTRKELYEFRVASRRVRDVSGCHEDARWCFRNGLYAEMAESLDAAGQLDASHPETLRLQRLLQVATNSSQNPIAVGSQNEPTEAAVIATADFIEAIPGPMKAQPLRKSDSELLQLNASAETLAFFTSRVQPILINRCGNSGCHRSPTPSNWELTHMGVQVRPPARMTRLNLAATLELINQAEPEQSDLLRYAIEPHAGRREPPLRKSDEVALSALHEWVHLVAESASRDDWTPLTPLTEMPGDATVVRPAAPSALSKSDARSPIAQAGYVQEQRPNAMLPSSPRPISAQTDTRPAARPIRLPPINDPFDPNIFNRSYRGEAATVGGTR